MRLPISTDRQKYTHNNITMKPLADNFITTARKVIEANYDNEEFGCLELCEALFMSRSNVHRKVKNALNISTSKFIMQVRLEKAREFLSQKDQSIASIAYQVGFADANYFSRAFSTFYGVSPTQYRQTLLKIY
ncbi:helix-turn-helix domain-containing protein [Emticicia soli]|uniref:Helix-turn-helix domain-containing protein n=1 Tax=Emticicia soli TaxID=2027878 RepID=A0ABW5J589_9BACT